MLGAMRRTGFVMSGKVKSGKMEEHTNMPNVNETGEQPKRRAVTAESMAAKQRDISVSEFFAKNRHLLGFDNPRKALLTADSRCSECRRWIELALRKHAKRRCHT